MKLPKVNLKVAALALVETAKKKSPDILIGLGIAGFMATVVIAVKVTPKAMGLIEERKDELDTDKLSVVETVKTAGPCYIVPLATATASTICIIKGVEKKDSAIASLVAACSMKEALLDEYQKKTLEIVGDKKEKEIRDSIAQDRVNKNPVSSNEVILTNKGTQLCYDSASGRYFKGDIEFLRRVENILNRRMVQDFEPYISLNDYYAEIELPPVSIGDDIGWNVNDDMIRFSFSSTLSENEVPCLVVDFVIRPRYDFRTLK